MNQFRHFILMLTAFSCASILSQAQIESGTDLTSLITNANCDQTASGVPSTADNQLPAANWTATNGAGVIVNTWSNEGDTDGSNMTVPFSQNWSMDKLPDGKIYHDQITNLEPGVYRITAYVRAFSFYNEFYEGQSNVSLYANDNMVDLSEGSHCQSGALIGYYGTYSVETLVLRGTLDFGFVLENTFATWVSFKNFTLTYVSKFEDEEAKELLDLYVSECEDKYVDYKANAEVSGNYQTALTNAKTATSDFSDYHKKLSDAVSALDVSIAEYKKFETVIAKAYTTINTLSENVHFQPVSGDVGDLVMQWEDAYNNGTATSEDIVAAYPQLRSVVKKGVIDCMQDGDDITIMVDNASCMETASGVPSTVDNQLPSANWTATNGKGAIVNTWSVEGDTDGSNMVVPFTQNFDFTTLPSGVISHDGLTGLKSGTYRISIFARLLCSSGTLYDGLSGVNFYANDKSVDMSEGERCQSGTLQGLYGVFTHEVLVTDGTLNFGFTLVNPNCIWVSFKDVKLTLVNELSVEKVRTNLGERITEAETLASEKMNTDVLSDLQKEITDAKAVYNQPTLGLADYVAAFESLTEKINIAKVSVDIYNQITELNVKAAALDADGQNAYSGTLAAYNSGTLEDYDTAYTGYTTAVKSQTTPGCDMTDAVANAACNIGNSEYTANWSSNVIKGIVVNTWSVEGLTDGTNMLVPFAQFWSEGILPSAILTHDGVDGLRNGYYSLSVFMRGLDWTGSIYLDKNTGVKFFANGHEIDMSNGETFASGAFQGYYGIYKLDFEVTEGRADFGFTLTDPHCTWLSFKDIHLTYLGQEAPVSINGTMVDANVSPVSCRVFTITGQEVETMTKGNVYIVNDKKYLAK